MTHSVWYIYNESWNREKNFFAIFFSNFSTRICSLYRSNWPMIWVSIESSRAELVIKRVKSFKSRLLKKNFWDSAKLFSYLYLRVYCGMGGFLVGLTWFGLCGFWPFGNGIPLGIVSAPGDSFGSSHFWKYNLLHEFGQKFISRSW